jgi:hypothetical protein
MNDLLKKLSERFGLTEVQSFEAFKMVLAFLQDKLPEPAGTQINDILITMDSKETPGNALKDLGSKFTTK